MTNIEERMRMTNMQYENMNAREDERVVHNFPPEGRAFGEDGLRYWSENTAAADADDKAAPRRRCYCDWTNTVPEHFGTVTIVDEADRLGSE